MSEMIERVAKAMAEATEKMLPARVWQHWEDMSMPAKAAYRVRARSVIEAMKLPTVPMLDAACLVGPDTNSGEFNYDDAANVYSAMINEALK